MGTGELTCGRTRAKAAGSPRPQGGRTHLLPVLTPGPQQLRAVPLLEPGQLGFKLQPQPPLHVPQLGLLLPAQAPHLCLTAPLQLRLLLLQLLTLGRVEGWGGRDGRVHGHKPAGCAQSLEPATPRLQHRGVGGMPFLLQSFMAVRCFPGGSVVKSLPAKQELQETQVPSLGQGDPLEEGMATHFSILAWRIPWTEEPGGPQFMGPQRVRHD